MSFSRFFKSASNANPDLFALLTGAFFAGGLIFGPLYYFARRSWLAKVLEMQPKLESTVLSPPVVDPVNPVDPVTSADSATGDEVTGTFQAMQNGHVPNGTPSSSVQYDTAESQRDFIQKIVGNDRMTLIEKAVGKINSKKLSGAQLDKVHYFIAQLLFFAAPTIANDDITINEIVDGQNIGELEQAYVPPSQDDGKILYTFLKADHKRSLYICDIPGGESTQGIYRDTITKELNIKQQNGNGATAQQPASLPGPKA